MSGWGWLFGWGTEEAESEKRATAIAQEALRRWTVKEDYSKAIELLYAAAGACPRSLMQAQLLSVLAMQLMDAEYFNLRHMSDLEREQSCERAADVYLEVYAIRREKLGEADDFVAATLSMRGRALLAASDYAPESRKRVYLLRAKADFDKAMGMLRAAGNDKSPYVVTIADSLSSLHAKFGEWEDAVRNARTAASVAASWFPPGHAHRIYWEKRLAATEEGARKGSAQLGARGP